MARIAKANKARRINALKGGKRRTNRISSSPIIHTPYRPKTTLWRHKKKAADAERLLHLTTIANIQLATNTSPSTRRLNSSRPTTSSHMSIDSSSRPSTGYGNLSFMAVAGSVSSVQEDSLIHDIDRSALQLIEENMDNLSSSQDKDSDEEFVDIEDLEISIGNPLPINSESISNTAFQGGVHKWPQTDSLYIKSRILKKGIIDMQKILSSKHCPTGQDHKWHLQVLYFMNWQMVSIKRKLNPQLQPTHIPLSRKVCAMNVALSFQQGQRVQERILRHEKSWIQERKIPISQQGKNAKMICMLEDEGTMLVVQECIAIAGPNLRAHDLVKAVTNHWQAIHTNSDRTQELLLLSDSLLEVEKVMTYPPLFQKKLSLSATTAVDWLHRMGFNWKEVKKGVYKDGHESPHVIKYQQEVFIHTLEELKPRMPYPIRNDEGEVVTIGLPTLAPNELLCIPVTHDECTCNANDGPHYQWIKGDEYPLRKKGRVQGLHISEFITPWGRLCLGDNVSDEEVLQLGLSKREVTEIIHCGGDVWWDQEQIVQQTLTAITIFEKAHPNCQALFLFDNATSHSAFAEDALRVSKMNKSWGGKQPQMRNGYYINEYGKKVTQNMSYGNERKILKKMRNQPKGIQRILEERGLWPEEGLYLDCSQQKSHGRGSSILRKA